jgi:malonyl CoA-acyl carrier protein transacylase
MLYHHLTWHCVACSDEQCVNGPKEQLDSTVISQPAIFVSSMACVEKLRTQDPAALESCTVAMGLSLGECVGRLHFACV